MADGELSLTAAGNRALREAENLCQRMDIQILAAEHLLAGALAAASVERDGLPGLDALVAAAESIHGRGMEPNDSNVMWGSSAREALNATVARLRADGVTSVSARLIALGVVASGEVNPEFYAGLGMTKRDLVLLLS